MSPVSLAAGGKQETNALLYLKKFGYIATNDGTEALVTEDNIQDYIQQGVRLVGDTGLSLVSWPQYSPLIGQLAAILISDWSAGRNTHL